MAVRLNSLLGVAIAQALLIGSMTYVGLRWFENTLETQLLLRAKSAAKSLAFASEKAILAGDTSSLQDLVNIVLSDGVVVAARLTTPQPAGDRFP